MNNEQTTKFASQSASAHPRAVGGAWGWGTGGCLSLLYYMAMLVEAGLRSPDPHAPDFRTLAGFDLLPSTRYMMRRLMGIDVAFNENDIFIPDNEDVPKLQETFAKHSKMAQWAEAIRGLPGTVAQGAGQEPGVGAAFLIHHHEAFAKFAAAKLANQRMPELLQQAMRRKQQPAIGQKARQISFATGFGGTGAGAAGIGMLTLLSQRNQPTENILICSTQPGEQDADDNKKTNLCTFLRQITRAARHPLKLPTWQRELEKGSEPLVDAIVLVSPETRYLSLGREAVYCAMARAGFEFLEGDPAVDQFFRDHEAEAALGGSVKIYQTFGAADLAMDAARARAMLVEIVRQKLCRRLLDGPAQARPQAQPVL